jgi:hypothetical protein
MAKREKPRLRRFDTVRATPAELRWLFPAEIVEWLDAAAEMFGFDPQSDPARPLPEDLLAYHEALDPLVDLLTAGGDTEAKRRAYARLPATDRAHLVFLARSAREAALQAQSQRPDTPLGYPPGLRGKVSTLLTAKWIDLTRGGRRHVTWTPLD